jgi:hypothetical protein
MRARFSAPALLLLAIGACSRPVEPVSVPAPAAVVNLVRIVEQGPDPLQSDSVDARFIDVSADNTPFAVRELRVNGIRIPIAVQESILYGTSTTGSPDSLPWQEQSVQVDSGNGFPGLDATITYHPALPLLTPGYLEQVSICSGVEISWEPVPENVLLVEVRVVPRDNPQLAMVNRYDIGVGKVQLTTPDLMRLPPGPAFIELRRARGNSGYMEGERQYLITATTITRIPIVLVP